jgi:hypothetical protein
MSCTNQTSGLSLSYNQRESIKLNKMKKQSEQAAAAKAIKSELKAEFPTVKFSVTSESFSMGDAVRVSWTDGPITSAVNELIKKYQYGNFNGMEDIYEHDNRIKGLPQTKYVTTSREKSEETKIQIAEKLGVDAGDPFSRHESGEYASTLIHQAFSQMSFV